MKKYILLGVCILMFVFAANLVFAADCCIWRTNDGNSTCGYTDLTNVTFVEGTPESFCNIAGSIFGDWHAFRTNVDGSCGDYVNDTVLVPECSNSIGRNLLIPEFGTIAATLALSGASMGYMFIRKRRK